VYFEESVHAMVVSVRERVIKIWGFLVKI
jgi:hypothetical protein